ncbi:PREDICTED: uncharacterized protein LOC109476879 [Branchiostoma belcheri]|uniref:Uncharacterized protein LOC109476879 n=1 Tax=Branchiostoma belcheri TaxID=7741 RepID=A0A6P4ZHF4_BRABE|nr:PREDICTED: uncharacterized protein LOC109476879 [Branchiostoma belcheri]
MADKKSDENRSTVREDRHVEEETEGLQKRVPKKADWVSEEESRRKKTHRSTVLGRLTHKSNVLKSLMERNDLSKVQENMEEWQKAYCDLEEASGDYQTTLDADQLKEDTEKWVGPRFAELDQFRDRVHEWINLTSEKEEETGIKPSDSVSQACSQGSSVASSARLRAELRRAELREKAAALDQKMKLQEREFQIKREEMELRRQQELLEVRTEMAQEEAKLKVIDNFEAYGQPQPRIRLPFELPTSEHQGERSDQFRTAPTVKKEPYQTSLNPEAASFTSTSRRDREKQNSPTPEEFLQGLVNQQAEVTKLMMEHNKKSSLPTRAIISFEGDPLSYTQFIKAFKHAIEDKTQDPEDRLHYLGQYTRGEARELVTSCVLMDPEEGFKEAKRLLEERYGTPFKVSRAYAEEAKRWSEIKHDDKPALRKFSLFLTKCLNAMKGDQYLQELDHYTNIALLVGKLPYRLKERWRRKSHDIQRQGRVKFKDLVDFVKQEEQVSSNDMFDDKSAKESFKRNPGTRYQRDRAKGSSLAVTTEPNQNRAFCQFCNSESHGLTVCKKLGGKPYKERLDYVKQKGLCYGCLSGTNHLAKECWKKATCTTCQMQHPTVLHRDTPHKQASVGCVKHSSREGVPSIIPVAVRSKKSGKTVQTYALLDNGSDVVICTEALKRQLKSKGRETKLSLSTINGTKEVKSEVLGDLEVLDMERNNCIPIPTAYVQEKIPVSKERIISTEDLKAWPYLREVEMPKINADIGLLIGNNVQSAMEPWRIINSQGGGPYAIKTLLGWSVNGPLMGASDGKMASVNRISLEQQLTQYFNNDFNEKIEDKKEMSVEDQRFMNIMSEGTKKEEGHYQVPLPFRNSRPVLPNNKSVALQRAKHLQKKMSKDEKFKEDYVQFVQTVIERGYAEKVPSEEMETEDTNGGKVWYIPHHGVYHPQKKKIRVVFDCAAPYAGTSLNKELLQGPDLTSTLVGVLTRFRQEPVALMADIEAMFSQVKVPVEDRDYLRFLWWPEGNLDKPLQEYRMAVHVFGATSSPSCASFALKKLAEDGEGRYTEKVLESIRNNFYVDDLLKSTSTVTEGGHLAKDMREACKEGGFRLTKWVSNSREVLKTVPVAEMSEEVRDLNLDLDTMPVERTLGMLWNVQTDTLGFRNVVKDKPATKRGILSTVSSMYDPLGLIAPATLQPKLLLQDLCREGTTWDEEIPDKHIESWRQWEVELPLLSRSFTVSRCVKPAGFGTPTSVQLHHFADASEVGYGTASYMRIGNQEGRVHCTLLMGKARVAPLKAHTIPRLELKAAEIAVRVNSTLQRELDVNVDETFFWTDSTTVLRYINNERTRYHTFVANRLTAIRNASDPKQWRYVESQQNPADDASRGQTIQKFVENDRWVNGPPFLWCSPSEWPQMPEGLQQPPQGDPEVKVNAIGVEEAQKSPMDALIVHYSSWHRLKKAVAWIIKVKQALRQKNNGHWSRIDNARSQNKAEGAIFKHVQHRYYHQEIVSLKRSKDAGVASTSSVYKLNPILGEDGLLRVGGRLDMSSLSEEEKHPIILPKESAVTPLIIRSIHEEVGHMGRNYVTAKVRERYWIPQSSTLIRKIISRCVTCRRHHGKTGEQKMADLPSHRVTPDEPPFTNVGVDYFGPFEVKRGRSIVKRYGVIFTCTTTRAVHLEKADSLDTDSCINALRRFIARRGQVKQIWSDNGTNLVGAKAELKKEIAGWNQDKIKDALLQKEVDWKFSPPKGSHFGGVWERQIRTIRQVLNAIMKKNPLDDEGLHTLLCEAESIVNGRPITAVNNEVDDLEALTPNRLLTMKMKTSLPPNLTSKNDLYARRRWKQVQYLADLFWKRWSQEYLTSLQERQKWGKQRQNLAVGDIVLLKDETSPRSCWPLGRVLEVTHHSDGLVRRVKVKTQNNVLERPIDKLCVLL